MSVRAPMGARKLILYLNYTPTLIFLQVVKDVTVESGTSVPTVEKNLKDINDTTGETTGWQDSADYDINDSVPFQLTATLLDNLASYDEYYLELSDTLSTGLTYNKDVKIYLVNGTEKKRYYFIIHNCC